MPQKCRVCAHKDTKEIEQLIVQGLPNTRIADKYGLDHQSVRYHKMNHLPRKLVRAVQKNKQEHAENILGGINDLLQRTKNILNDAEEEGQKTTALHAIREARATFELLSKIAVKLEEYRRQDEEKQTSIAEQQASEGLQALSDTELKVFIQLQSKIYSADPDYDLDPTVRMFVDSVRRMNGYDSPGFNTSLKESGFYDDSPDDVRRTSARQHKNTQIENDDLLLDDLDDLDLELDDLSNEIPSEQSDPEWLRRERRRRRRRRR